jgi:diguanylate cyclase (GGDEF)-like protein/PAS domain S-box-containing protein
MEETVQNEVESASQARQLKYVGANNSLANRIALWFSILVVFAFSAVLYYTVYEERALLLAYKLDEMEFEAKEKISRFSEEISHAENDVLFLAATPPIKGIIQTLDANETDGNKKNSLAKWRNQLEQFFTQFLRQHDSYFQIRFLGGANRGTELVRLERTPDGIIRTVPQEELQDKSHRNYVQDTLALPQGGVRYSRINLNRENGMVSIPHIPTVRVSSPVYHNGEIFGLLVINLDLRRALKDYVEQFPWSAQVSLVDAGGVFLANADQNKRFGADLKTDYRLATEYPNAWKALSSLVPADENRFLSSTIIEPHAVCYVAKFFLGEVNRGPLLGTVIQVSKSSIFKGINANLRKTIILAMLVMVLCVIVIWLLSRKAVMPLTTLAGEVRAFGRGVETPTLSLKRHDEVGDLAQAFQRMREQIKERSHKLAQQEQRLRSIVEHAADGIMLTDCAGVILDSNPAAEFLFGYDDGELLGRNIRQLVSPPYVSIFEQRLSVYLNDQDGSLSSCSKEVEGKSRDGVSIDIRFTMSKYMIDGETYFTVMVYDIGERKHLEMELRKSNEYLEERVCRRTKELEKINAELLSEAERHRITRARLFIANTIFEKTPQAIVICDGNNIIRDVNPAYTLMTGFSHEYAVGRTPAITKSGRHDAEYYQLMWKSIIEQNHWEGEIWDRRSNGEIFPKYLTIDRILNDEGQVLNYVATFYDLSDQKATEAELEQRANFDPLTKLPNADMFRGRLELECNLAKRFNRKVGLFILNIDRFKQINDSFGYHHGDRLLCELGDRLHERLHKMDMFGQDGTDPNSGALSRLGGDTFAFMVLDLGDSANAAIVAQRIITRMEQPFKVGGQDIFLTCSIGVSIFPDNSSNLDTQMLCAERALHRARELGGGQYKYYSYEMDRSSLKQVILEADLRRAVLGDDLRLHYQPKLYLPSGEIIGMEALVRWPTSDGSQIYPDEFIPLAESTGLIIPMGRWILRQACMDTKMLNDRHGLNLKVAVNLSMRQFQQLDLIEMVKEVLDETGIAPTNVELEITESMVMIDQKKALSMMRGLKKLGVMLSIDDFGTGYSSLAHLRRFPVDALKIDRSFVSDLEYDYEDASIVSAVCSLGRSLGLLVVAEGVETEGHMQFLKENHCDMAQGYHISRAIPIDAFEEYIQLYSEAQNREIT